MVLNHGCINGQIQVAGGGDLKSGDGIFQLLHGNRDTCLGGDFTDGHRNQHGRPGRDGESGELSQRFRNASAQDLRLNVIVNPRSPATHQHPAVPW